MGIIADIAPGRVYGIDLYKDGGGGDFFFFLHHKKLVIAFEAWLAGHSIPSVRANARNAKTERKRGRFLHFFIRLYPREMMMKRSALWIWRKAGTSAFARLCIQMYIYYSIVHAVALHKTHGDRGNRIMCLI
jgi:hypothetical protein